MSTGSSRYRDPERPDYGHGFHAGNVGDVWKHFGLVEALRLVSEAGVPVRYLESHAGEGRYRLGSTGEWTAGIERVAAAVDASPHDGPDSVTRWVELCRRLGYAGRSSTWAGSPAVAAALLGTADRLFLRERDPHAHATLARHFEGDPRVDELGNSYVRKPLFSREGANVELVDEGRKAAVLDQGYGEEGHIRQALHTITAFDGNYPVIGAWIVGDEPAGIGIREDRSRVTKNLSRFVPHAIVG